MTLKKIEPGPTGMTVARNVRRYRVARPNLTYAELSRRLTDLGHSIPPLGLRHLEEGNRRIDVDDLVAIALVLNVSPLALLLPTDDSRLVEKGDQLPHDRICMWGLGQYPLWGDPIAFMQDSSLGTPPPIIAGVVSPPVGVVRYSVPPAVVEYQRNAGTEEVQR